jgi:hypothetical protein
LVEIDKVVENNKSFIVKYCIFFVMITLYVYPDSFHNLEKIFNIHVSGLNYVIKPSIIQGRVWGNRSQAKFEHLRTWWCSLWSPHMQANFLTSAWWRALYLAIIFLMKEIIDIQQVFTFSRIFNALTFNKDVCLSSSRTLLLDCKTHDNTPSNNYFMLSTNDRCI